MIFASRTAPSSSGWRPAGEAGAQFVRLRGATCGDPAMTCTYRSALALFLCFSLLSLTCVAQPLAESRSQGSTKQFPEDQPGFPQYPGAQSGSQPGTTQYPEVKRVSPMRYTISKRS